MIYSNAITQGKIKQVHSEAKSNTEESTMHWINRNFKRNNFPARELTIHFGIVHSRREIFRE